MLAVLLYLVVAGVTLAVGQNVLRTAKEAGQAEADLFGFGDRYAVARMWSFRLMGLVLFLLGIALLIAGSIAAWRLSTGP